MGDWIGLGLIVLVLAGALAGLSRLGRAPVRVSPEEFERRVQEARGTTRSGAFAGLYALQKLLNPRAAEAVEVLRDMREGYYDDTERAGDGDGGGRDVRGDGPEGRPGGAGLLGENGGGERRDA